MFHFKADKTGVTFWVIEDLADFYSAKVIGHNKSVLKFPAVKQKLKEQR